MNYYYSNLFSKPNNIHLKKIMSHGMMDNIAHKKNIIRILKTQIYNLCDKSHVMNWANIISQANDLACTNDKQI
jgi:hypothetical protein